ncbi:MULTISPECIES: hypothetical protein [unclassified Pseudomonas]|uniref:hypothetical protein n=1 Tax=unclassified Pseudomonas TaxID=196821 RepID=UPI002AC8DDC9|nr:MULTISPECIES: hypothetical protein [unclassified Pseudomonas]MEB0041106.1 hypothetical protein [Pseudomonas sp. MH10]MEB0120290.1 hypothetical protein [Pseudomonas sp. CCI1.2]WPX65652.1 hypothetical protein RHM59_08405 [Pseudomonas sp. MH10]
MSIVRLWGGLLIFKRYLISIFSSNPSSLLNLSKPACAFWEVSWLDAEQMHFTFTGSPSIYRYWDATECVVFTLEMAKQALEVELREETQFLHRFDVLVSAVIVRYDIRGNVLNKPVRQCLDQNGVVSQNRRKQYQGFVDADVFDFLEQYALALLADGLIEQPKG